MEGRARVEQNRARVQAVFERAAAANSTVEMQSDLARNLCVLVSGFVEKSVTELLVVFARRVGSPVLQSYVENSLRRLTNVNKEKLLQLLGSFDPDWRTEYDAFIIDEREAALNSVVELRNRIAHGEFSTLSLGRMREYWEGIQKIIDHLEDKLDPV